MRQFLDRFWERHRSFDEVTITDIDAAIARKGDQDGYARTSIQSYVNALRAFFYYAEQRGWCRSGLRFAMKLKELIAQHTAFRKSMGEDFESAESLLNTFCRRIRVEIEVGAICAERAEAFLAGTGPVNHYWRRKYDTLRGLYRYATSRGLVDQVPLPSTVPKMPERFVPYIYNLDELSSPHGS